LCSFTFSLSLSLSLSLFRLDSLGVYVKARFATIVLLFHSLSLFRPLLLLPTLVTRPKRSDRVFTRSQTTIASASSASSSSLLRFFQYHFYFAFSFVCLSSTEKTLCFQFDPQSVRDQIAQFAAILSTRSSPTRSHPDTKQIICLPPSPSLALNLFHIMTTYSYVRIYIHFRFRSSDQTKTVEKKRSTSNDHCPCAQITVWPIAHLNCARINQSN
jgi:hypothetical protein